MKITVSMQETGFNRANRKVESREVVNGWAYLPREVSLELRKCAKEYRISPAEMVRLCLCYYFGDGKNHFNCEFCEFWHGDCDIPKPGTQTTIPLLDKGMVVVGLPSDDQGK